MTSTVRWEDVVERVGPLRQLSGWLNALPHPGLVLEFAQTHVAAARWDARGQKLEGHASEPLPEGAIIPSPVEVNIVQVEPVQAALAVVLKRLDAKNEEAGLLVPDPVVRVFILPFETFPRRPEEGIPMLRWRLKKSVPFDVEETVVSSMRQAGKDGKLEVVAALGRQRVLREYEGLAEAAGLVPGVALSSSLAAIALLDEKGATLLARISGRHLTTVIVKGSSLCVYRSSEMPASIAGVELKSLMEEIFPGVAYFQDTWGGNVERARLAGFGEREAEMRELLGSELNCPILSMGEAHAGIQLPADAGGLLAQNLEGLAGWALERRA